MNSRVPVRLEWDLRTGKRIKVEAHTRVVNPYGCMVVLEHDLPLEHRVALTNVPMNASNAAVIVWKKRRASGRWLGIRRGVGRSGHGFLGARTVKPPTPQSEAGNDNSLRPSGRSAAAYRGGASPLAARAGPHAGDHSRGREGASGQYAHGQRWRRHGDPEGRNQ